MRTSVVYNHYRICAEMIILCILSTYQEPEQLVLKTSESLCDTALTTTLSELRFWHSNVIRVLMVTVLRASGRCGFIHSLLSVGCGEDDQVLCNGKR